MVHRHCRSSAVIVVFICLCVGGDLPPSSGDADQGCPWETQTDEGWIRY
jgi:hypothetical protein